MAASVNDPQHLRFDRLNPNDKWGIPVFRSQAGLSVRDMNPEGSFVNHRAASSLNSMDAFRPTQKDISEYKDANPTHKDAAENLAVPTGEEAAKSEEEVQEMKDGKPMPTNRNAALAAQIAQVAQETGKGISNIMTSESTSKNLGAYTKERNNPGMHADLHADIRRAQADSNASRANTYGQIGALFGPIGMLLGQLGAHLTQKEYSNDDPIFNTARSFNGNVNPQDDIIVNTASNINQPD